MLCAGIQYIHASPPLQIICIAIGNYRTVVVKVQFDDLSYPCVFYRFVRVVFEAKDQRHVDRIQGVMCCFFYD